MPISMRLTCTVTFCIFCGSVINYFSTGNPRSTFDQLGAVEFTFPGDVVLNVTNPPGGTTLVTSGKRRMLTDPTEVSGSLRSLLQGGQGTLAEFVTSMNRVSGVLAKFTDDVNGVLTALDDANTQVLAYLMKA